jgi:Trp operon repressor
MTNVSKKFLSSELENQTWERLLEAVRVSVTGKNLKSQASKFLTPAEITMLEKRLAIPILLEKHYSYRKIGETIDVSPATISFVKHNLRKKPVTHRKYSSWPKSEPKNDWSSIGPFMTPQEHIRRMRRKVGL